MDHFQKSFYKFCSQRHLKLIAIQIDYYQFPIFYHPNLDFRPTRRTAATLDYWSHVVYRQVFGDPFKTFYSIIYHSNSNMNKL